jgi:hypothetical protein
MGKTYCILGEEAGIMQSLCSCEWWDHCGFFLITRDLIAKPKGKKNISRTGKTKAQKELNILQQYLEASPRLT